MSDIELKAKSTEKRTISSLIPKENPLSGALLVLLLRSEFQLRWLKQFGESSCREANAAAATMISLHPVAKSTAIDMQEAFSKEKVLTNISLFAGATDALLHDVQRVVDDIIDLIAPLHHCGALPQEEAENLLEEGNQMELVN